MRADVVDLFEFDPALTHLNHGAFGAVPRVVREAQDRARARIEVAPMRAFRDELPQQLAAARETAAAFLGLAADSAPLVRNVSEGVAIVLRALHVGRGDDVVVSNHGYPTVSWAVQANGGTVREAAFDAAATTTDIVAAFTEALTPETRLVVIDQITSPTALLLPVAEVAAAVAPVPVLVDAAHVPGALPDLNIEALGVAFWVGNLHKWAFTPRSAAVLWADPERRIDLRPVVTSWSHGEPYPASFDLQGTVDHSAWLAIPDAIDFWQRLGGWDQVERNAALLRRGADHVAKALGAGSELGGIPSAPCMTLVPLPDGVAETQEAAEALWHQLYAAGFVVPPVSFGGRGFVRLAAHAYNDEDDYARLAETLVTLVGDG
ncbi:MAG TPA: aminotransferase class I/II-fold pyridoxal phosphate-dependent enzyme [Intrasporangium sp.]|uniref:aminotransferase class I/II-fold pyridoxal phosphate-dependent enzyme n=1 Tax=Intrasporangium sp. TaxID=1925024 RepID=UPI002B49CA63|nr:aminotransferase class I/II-fold pyridoxal phosphate-dependent enzyme [Intrasporangium sp.]HKX67083.1 aminotransferase class I/II-fold pyridoxal phosphate-dependent enzyme [Intrasporangium sp.]